MPKQKTKKTISKRFKITKSGKILRGRQYGRHRRFHKSRSLRKTYKKSVELTKSQTKVIRKLI